MFGLDPTMTGLLVFCVLTACVFEFINGFHDTANAVATVIYTKSLKPSYAVIWSGIWNFIGVFVGGISVAMGIVNLLPMEALLDQSIYHNVAMIFSLLITAIIWNLWTWYFGIPCSSSHTLIGSIFGIGIAFMLLPGGENVSLNWVKVEDAGLSLMISPIFGFGLALFLMMLLKKTIKDKSIFDQPDITKPPPPWIRAILILTSTSVSFSHGSNDGQKGVGLIMIILITIVPVHFAIDRSQSPSALSLDLGKVQTSIAKIDTADLSDIDLFYYKKMSSKVSNLRQGLDTINNFNQLPNQKHFEIRKDIMQLSKKYEVFLGDMEAATNKPLPVKEIKALRKELKSLAKYTEYAPYWVILLISVSLGLGTMVGWKRIVVTIGEKIGKTHLNYMQGATSNLIAASTIGFSTWLGLPVSTTHVLSSGVAGTMVAGKGLKNLKKKTIKSIAIAWLVTLPITMIMAAGIFLLLRYFIK